MKLAVIGTGYVGLTTGACLAEVGHQVICVDIDETKIARLKKAEIPIYEPGLAELVKKNHAAGRLQFTTELSDIGEPEAIFFALPTPPNGDGEADLQFVMKAARDVAKTIKDYTVLVNKSTVPIGTAQKVREVVAAETIVPFDVVSNPEFLREGFAVDDWLHPDRIVVGASSKRAREVMEELYRPFTTIGAPLLFMDEASAELTKYAANSFLALKISFMNEIANLSTLVGADVENVRVGIGADERIGQRFLRAGIGYGGSCFPKDVMALDKIAAHHDYNFKLVKATMAVNQRQRQLFVETILNHYSQRLKGKTIAVWGIAFKPDTDDIREAPSLDIMRELVKNGATVRAYDPQAAANAKLVLGETITYAPSAQAALAGADALVVVTEWKEFTTIDPATIAAALKDKVMFDGRNIFSPQVMQAAGLTYVSVGRKAITNG
ncbi:MAG TPA: UDP-glucose/GDP-mannose dehydrogenase family protein [Candidatus Saccharimonadales bacterium]|nr:UDP-glucose/GDP-mannose dehydrogenase family protein [Candidatus Saccharimonadales bacterium]